MTIFISYTYESDEHLQWVRRLAQDLTFNGFTVTLDQWNLSAGADLYHFMERGIEESEYVLAICTPQYKLRADTRSGGGGFETRIASALLASDALAAKFVPILRAGSSTESIPTYLRAAVYIDFSDDASYEHNLRRLIEDLYRTEKQPPVGWRKYGEEAIFGLTAPPSGAASLRESRTRGSQRPKLLRAASIELVRQLTGVRALHPLENELPLTDLPNGCFGYSTSWSLNSDPRGIVGGTGLSVLRLHRSSGGTVQLEIHKTPTGEVYLAGYSSAEEIDHAFSDDRSSSIKMMLLAEPYEDYDMPLAVPYSRIGSINSRSVDGGPYLLDLLVD